MTKKEAFEIAKKYNSVKEFVEKENSCKCFLSKNKWYMEATKHFVRKNTTYTKKEIISFSKQYKTKKDWKIGHKKSYDVCARKYWLFDECIVGHMESSRKSIDFTIDEISEEANKYEFRSHFRDSSGAIFRYAKKIGVLDEVCKHMKNQKDWRWSREDIKKSALQYNTKADWRRGDASAYKACTHRKWMQDDDIIGHMKTRNLSYSFEDVVADARKYDERGIWGRESKSIYMYAWRRKWHLKHEVVGHMSERFVWTEELVREYASKCVTKNDFGKKHRARLAAIKFGALDEINETLKDGYFTVTIDEIIAEAKKYKTRAEWWEFGRSTYRSAQHRGILDDEEITGHMICGIQHRRGGSGENGLRMEDIFANEFIFPLYGKENVIRDKKLGSLPFRPDFLIESEKLVVEFDERRHYHSNQYKYNDPIRQKAIEDIGYTVVRFTEQDLKDHLNYIDKSYLLDK